MKSILASLIMLFSNNLYHDTTARLSLIQSIQLTKQEELCLIKNAYHEAFNQGAIGMALVTKVVMNRAYNSNKTFCDIVYAPFQFSWTLSKERYINKKDFEKVKSVVLNVYHGILEVPYEFKTATFFHTKAVKPKWRKKVIRVGVWKDHIFYKTP